MTTVIMINQITSPTNLRPFAVGKHVRTTVWVLVALLFTFRLSAQQKTQATMMEKQSGIETATFGSGCFWCTEAIFLNVEGVTKVESGYTGGKVKNPTYKEVCSGLTGHAEVIQLQFDPKVISYDQLLEIFWKTHDPTTLNQQGADVGTQYRSVVYYHNEEQKEKAEYYKKEVDKSGAYEKPIVTEVSAASIFYPAEDYHQEYYQNNKNTNPYCSIVIRNTGGGYSKSFKPEAGRQDGLEVYSLF